MERGLWEVLEGRNGKEKCNEFIISKIFFKFLFCIYIISRVSGIDILAGPWVTQELVVWALHLGEL